MRINILIVVVVYNENIFETRVYHSLLKNVQNRIYVYDNSEVLYLKGDIPQTWIYHFDGENRGISTAYNSAAKYAKANQFNWLLFCDQDTIFPPNYIKNVTQSIKNNPNINLFVPNVVLDDGVILSPARSLYGIIIKKANHPRTGILPICKYSIINSGIIVSLDAFFKCGGYNEKVWLDYSDIQFFERFSRHYSSFYALGVTCLQNFSNKDTDISRLNNRFHKFCDSVVNYETYSWINKFIIHIMVLKHTLALVVRTKNIKFVKIFIRDYLFK